MRHFDFTDLTPRWQQTAAARLPIVLWQDVVAAPERQATYVHRDFCSLYVVRRGRGTHVIEGVRYGIARGDVYVMGAGMSHHFEGCDRLVTDTFHFQPTLFDRETRDALAATPGFHSLFVRDTPPGTEDGPQEGISPPEAGRERWLHLTPTQHDTVAATLRELQTEWSASVCDLSVLLTRALFLRLLVHLSRFRAESRSPAASLSQRHTSAPPPGFAGGQEETVAIAVRYMEEHFAERLRIERLAAMVFLSPDRFTGVFAAVMGRTPRDYLHHLRIEHAKMLLATTMEPIGRVAQAAGFAEPAYFTRVVRAATGLSPTTYRRAHSA